MQQLQRFYAFIGTVPESRMRLILTLRFAAGMDWRQVAKTLNDGFTADTAKKRPAAAIWKARNEWLFWQF